MIAGTVINLRALLFIYTSSLIKIDKFPRTCTTIEKLINISIPSSRADAATVGLTSAT